MRRTLDREDLDLIDNENYTVFDTLIREYNRTGVLGLTLSPDEVDDRTDEVENLQDTFRGLRCRVVSLCESIPMWPLISGLLVLVNLAHSWFC